MSFKKTMLAIAAAGVVTATAVPAMALENEFHGMYKMKYFISNFDNSGSGYYAETAAATTSRSAVNYFEQRARLFYTAKANDNLKLVTGFELDSVFGDKSQGTLAGTTGVGTTGNITTAFRNSGGALDTDAVNLETKWVYLDFNVPNTTTNVKVGAQPIKDSIKGVLFDCDAAGIITSTKVADATVNLGYFRGYEGNAGDVNGGGTAGLGLKMGVNNLDLAIVEGKYAISKDLSVGLGYYGIYDYRDYANQMFDNTVAAFADGKVGPVALSGFVAGQFGKIYNDAGVNSTMNGNTSNTDLSGFAANAAAKVKVGPGSARLAFLYTSGDDGTDANKNKSWQSLQQSVNGLPSATKAGALNTYNESGMMLLNRNAAAQGGSSDRSIMYTTGNRDQGIIGAFAGYDATITPKVYASANVGIGFTAEDRTHNNNDKGDADAIKPKNLKTGQFNSSNFLGTEINVEGGYKLYDNLTASVQAAYVILGDYYKGTSVSTAGDDPANPYSVRFVVSYVF
ncbi:histidine kinase [Geomonas sp. Red276]